RLHALVAFARNTTRYNRSNCSADAARREEHTDSAGRILAHRKYAFTEHGQQGEYATAQTPGRFDEQKRQHARTILDVPDTVDCLSYSQEAANRQLLSLAFPALRKTDTTNQNRG